MKSRLILLFFVALFAVLSCTYGLRFFEDYRDRKGFERKTQNFSPENTIVATLYGMSSEPPVEMAEELMDLADRLDGDIILGASVPMYPEDKPVEMPSRIHFVYSDKTDLFAGNAFSEPEVDWSRSGQEVFSLKAEPGLGSILTIRNRLEGKDIELERQQIVAPLALLNEYYPKLGSQPDITIYFQCEDIEAAQTYLRSQMKTISFSSVERYDEYYKAMYYFEPVTQGPPYLMAVIFMAAILMIILAIFSLEVIEATREIGVRKMLGQGRQHIVSRLLYRLVFTILSVFVLAAVITLLIVVKNWNRLTLTFVGLLALLLLAFIVMLLLSLLIAHAYVKRINPVVSTKRQSSLSFFLNFGFLMKIILVLLLGTQLLALFPNLVTVWGEWRAERVYGQSHLELTVSDKCPENQRVNTESKLMRALQSAVDSLEFIYGHSSPIGTQIGSLNKKGEIVLIPLTEAQGMATYQVTLKNEIFDLDGEKVRFEEPPEKSTLLVPENTDLESLELNPSFPRLRGTPQIPIRSGQTVLMPDGEYLKDAILLVLSDEDAINSGANFLDTAENRAILAAKIEEQGVDSSYWQFTTTPLIQLGEHSKYTLGRYLWLAVFLLAAFIVQSAHNAEVYVSDRAKLLHLRYLHGVSFLRRYIGLWLRASVPYLMALLIALLFPSLIHSLMLVS